MVEGVQQAPVLVGTFFMVFELPRVKNCMSRLCTHLLGARTNAQRR